MPIFEIGEHRTIVIGHGYMSNMKVVLIPRFHDRHTRFRPRVATDRSGVHVVPGSHYIECVMVVSEEDDIRLAGLEHRV